MANDGSRGTFSYKDWITTGSHDIDFKKATMLLPNYQQIGQTLGIFAAQQCNFGRAAGRHTAIFTVGQRALVADWPTRAENCAFHYRKTTNNRPPP